MWGSSFSSESCVGIVLLICRLTVSLNGKRALTTCGKTQQKLPFNVLFSFFLCFLASVQKKWREAGGTKSANPVFAECSRRPLGFAEVEVFEKLQVVRCWEFLKVCVFRPPHAHIVSWHGRVPSGSSSRANCSQSRLRIYVHIPASQ